MLFVARHNAFLLCRPLPKTNYRVSVFIKCRKKESGSFRPWVVSAGSFRPGSLRSIFGWVVSALVGGSFRSIFGVSRFGPGSFWPNSLQANKVLTDGRLVW